MDAAESGPISLIVQQAQRLQRFGIDLAKYALNANELEIEKPHPAGHIFVAIRAC
jgi:hypothetical protein